MAAKFTTNADLLVQEDRIKTALTRFYEREGWQPVDHHTPLESLIMGEEGQTDFAEAHCRMEVLIILLDFLCQDGVHPGAIVRRIYCLGKFLNRPPWSKLTAHEMGLMMGETRAAVVFRIKRIFTGYLKDRGAKGFKAPFQKDEATVAKYRAAAKGNTNRRDSARKNQGRKRSRNGAPPPLKISNSTNNHHAK